VRDIADQQRVLHELRKRIIKRFKKEGIEIPLPSQTVVSKRNLREDKTDQQKKSMNFCLIQSRLLLSQTLLFLNNIPTCRYMMYLAGLTALSV